jgi:hypothetical protein
MNLRNSLYAVLAIASSAVVPAAQHEWPKSSASELSVFATLQRFRIYADHCSAGIPRLKPDFDSLMENLGRRVGDMARDLLATAMFRDLVGKPVPEEVIFSLEDAFHDVGHNIQRQDAASICPKALQNLRDVKDETLKSELAASLAAVRNLIRNLENEGARQGLPPLP